MLRLRNMMGTLFARYRRAERLYRDRAHLKRLDDRLLDDIGFTRDQIDALLDQGLSARAPRQREIDRRGHAARLQ